METERYKTFRSKINKPKQPETKEEPVIDNDLTTSEPDTRPQRLFRSLFKRSSKGRVIFI